MLIISRNLPKRIVALTTALLLAPHGQVELRPPIETHSSGANRVHATAVIDITTSERWMHGLQAPSFTPANRSTRWVSIHGEKIGANGTRVLAMEFVDPFLGRDSATVTLDRRKRIVRVATSVPPQTVTKFPMFTAHQELLNRFLDGDLVALPATRVWDVLPTRAPGRILAHGSWRDTIDLRATEGLFSQRLSGARISTIVGDTLVRGRRYPIIRDSAVVSYFERGEREARTLDTFVVVERRAHGSIVGRYLLDSVTDVFHVRDDTTHLEGEASLKYPDGRSFVTPAVFERIRHLATYSYAEYDSLRSERESHQEEFSIVVRPEGIAERIVAGDARAEDSVLAILSASRDADQREQIHGLIARWSRKRAVRQAMEAEAFSSGDLAFALSRANKRWQSAREQVDSATMRELLKVLSDPGFAFSLGIKPDVFYESANDALLAHPPAAASDTSKWPCTPDACRLLAAQRRTATEPRLRALALVAMLTMNPTSMCDSAFADGARATMMTGVQTLAIATSSGKCGTVSGVLPMQHANWTDWNSWIRQTRGWVYNPRVRFGDSRLRSDSIPLFRMAERVSGRDLQSEWRASFANESSDSAKLVYGSLLAAMGKVGESTARIASRIQSAKDADRRLGVQEMLALFPAQSHVADSVVAADVVGTLLAASLDGAKSWPLLLASDARDSARDTPHRVVQALDGAYGPKEKSISEPIILYRNGIPAAVLETMRRRGVQIVDSGFALPSTASALELTITAPQEAGPFLMISLTHDHEGARIAGRGQSWASGSTYYLLHTESGWRIVTASTWIT